MHKTVFLNEAVDLLQLKAGDVVVDATFGEGGHSEEILKRIGSSGKLLVFDRDPKAIELANAMAERNSNLTVFHQDFRCLDTALAEKDIHQVNGVLFDFGISQGQLDTSGRGFSFRTQEPLDMRMNPEDDLTAHLIVNSYSEEALRTIISEYGEDYRARRIARAIKEQRQRSPIQTAGELAELVMRISKPRERHARVHPATKTFQALRIAVNDELGAIQEGLKKAISLLVGTGRCVAISFHSLEDRIVKLLFREEANAGRLTLITKKPLQVSSAELAANPRARSAKIRVAERVMSGFSNR